MRKVVLYTLLSLDGVAEEPGDWMTDFDQPIFDNLARVIATQDTVLLGRGTYDYWANTVAVDGPAEDHVRALREGDGGDIGIHGSIRLARSLSEAGLVDEYRLVVSSNVAGRGERLFGDDGPPRSLELVGVENTRGGSLLLGYRPAS